MRVIHFERNPVPGTFFSIERVFREVRRVLSGKFSIDIVHCPTPYHSNWWLFQGITRAYSQKGDINHIAGDIHYVALGLPGSRTILTIHDLNRLDELRGLRKHLYSLLYFTLPLRRSQFVTTISSTTRERLVAQFPFAAPKITVIPDCVPQGFTPKPKPFNFAHPRVLQIGTKDNKNIKRLARALEAVPHTLHVVGRLDAEQRTMLKELNIHYENSVDLSDADLIRAYEDADILAFVSLTEGFGMPIVEAQAIGRPVITSDLAPMNETAGGGACLVNPFDPADIRAGILRIIGDVSYRHLLIEKGFRNVARFSRDTIAAKYSALYHEVLAICGTIEPSAVHC
jgi:glycosyltransferase involved in cell wall biosynthesis